MGNKMHECLPKLNRLIKEKVVTAKQVSDSEGMGSHRQS